MTPSTNEQFNHYYALHCKHLKLKGLQPKTIEAYTRAISRRAKLVASCRVKVPVG
jgi:integrase/recombinase XerD